MEIWPTEPKGKAEEPEAWVLPLDEPDQQSPAVRLARRADLVYAIIAACLPALRRPEYRAISRAIITAT